jgi:2-aminoadipate transaminase
MNYDNLLAGRTANMKASAIRELLKLAADPEMISLAGGLPSPDSFPVDLMMELTGKVMAKYGSSALQYDMTEGFLPFRKALINYCAGKGINARLENLYITTGSQGLLDAIGKLFISVGDYVAVEGPTYLAALQAFNSYEARFVQIKTDDEGLIPESLEETVAKYPIKFIYTIPTFQNPSGKSIGIKRRMETAEIIRKHNLLLIEDDPYGDLRYKGERLPTIKSMAPENVIYTSTLSKIFAPGLRLGFFVAPEELGRWLVIVKQGVDLHTSTYTQALAAEYLAGGYAKNQVEKILKIYAPKLQTMLDSLEQYFPHGFKWSKPEGGMFLWFEGPEGLDMEEVLIRSLKRGIGFVPGKFFFPNPGEGNETARFNFTNSSEDQIRYAVKILAKVIKEKP